MTTAGQRVRELTLANGTPNRQRRPRPGAPSVDIVTNNFMANGGDNYPWLAAKTKVTPRTADDLAIPYELPVRQYLQTLAVGASGLPTVLASDVRYAPYPTGVVSPANARITIVSS